MAMIDCCQLETVFIKFPSCHFKEQFKTRQRFSTVCSTRRKAQNMTKKNLFDDLRGSWNPQYSRSKNATEISTYNSLRIRALTSLMKTTSVFSIGANIAKIRLSLYLMSCVRLVWYYGKMYSRHLCFYRELQRVLVLACQFCIRWPNHQLLL